MLFGVDDSLLVFLKNPLLKQSQWVGVCEGEQQLAFELEIVMAVRMSRWGMMRGRVGEGRGASGAVGGGEGCCRGRGAEGFGEGRLHCKFELVSLRLQMHYNYHALSPFILLGLEMDDGEVVATPALVSEIIADHELTPQHPGESADGQTEIMKNGQIQQEVPNSGVRLQVRLITPRSGVQVLTPRSGFQMVSPLSRVFQQLNPQKPADKALALSLKMVQYRQAREANRIKMIKQYRSSRSQQTEDIYGSVSRVIEKQNYINRHNYLRDGQDYATLELTPRRRMVQPIALPKLSINERRVAIRHEVEVLNRSQLMSVRYQARKIVLSLLQQVIDRSVDTYHKKCRFYGKATPKKISQLLAESMVRGRSHSRNRVELSLSRAFGISIGSQEQSDCDRNGHSSNQNQSDDEREQEESGSEQGEQQSEDQQAEGKEGDSKDGDAVSNSDQMEVDNESESDAKHISKF